jgi:hypothetical protein
LEFGGDWSKGRAWLGQVEDEYQKRFGIVPFERLQELVRFRRAFHLIQPKLFLRVFSMLTARLLVLSVHDDGLRRFLVA